MRFVLWRWVWIIAMFALSTISTAWAGAGWTDYAAVEELNPTGLHYYVVRLGVKQNSSGCNDQQKFFQDYKTEGSDKMFSILLEALKTGMRVRVYVSGKCNLHGHAEFTAVSVIRP